MIEHLLIYIFFFTIYVGGGRIIMACFSMYVGGLNRQWQTCRDCTKVSDFVDGIE
jgi:hypothetical protein